MTGHSPSQDQDLRTALAEALNAADYLSDRYKALWHGKTVRDIGEAEAAREAASKKLAGIYALTPAQAPDKAGEREGLTMMRDRLDLCRRMAEDADFPEQREGFRLEAKKMEAALAHQPTRTEASRDVGVHTIDLPKPTKDQREYLERTRLAVSDFDPDTLIRGHDPFGKGAQYPTGMRTVRVGAATPTPPLSPSEPAGRKTADVGVFGPIDGMGNRDLSGSYIGLSVSGKHFAHGFRISLGAAEVLSAELAGLLGHELAPPLSPDSTGPAGAELVDAVVDALALPHAGDRERIAAAIEARWNAIVGPSAGSGIGLSRRTMCQEFAAALTPSAPIAAPASGYAEYTPVTIGTGTTIAAPVRDDGARVVELAQAWRTARLTACAEPIGNAQVWTDLGAAETALSQALASLPAPAGDVPGEAQTRQEWRREKLDKVIKTTVHAHAREQLSRDECADLVRGLLADFDDMTAGRHEFADCYAPEAQTQEGGR